MSNISDKPWLVPGHMYQYDIGWLVDKLLSFETELNTAIDLKTIHYADPIQWDITTQYAPNTVVVDPKTGTAYMSKVPVPAGVLLTNKDYWVVIFNYQRIYDKIMSGVAFNDKDNLNASKDLLVNDLVWFGGDLYRCTRDINKGTTYIPGTNLTPTTIADCLETYYGRDRVAQVLNDTINVSEDYTLNAGNIAETASNVTIHSTRDMLLDADGTLTERVTGDKTSEVGGKLTERVTGDKTSEVGGKLTERVTGDKTSEVGGKLTVRVTGSREIDVDGDDTIHVDGVTSINRVGAVTEVYGSSESKTVTGASTEIYKDTVTRTLEGKAIVNGKDIEATVESVVLHFPDKTVDLSDISSSLEGFVNVTDFGAVGDGVTDDTAAFKRAIEYCISNNVGLYVPALGRWDNDKGYILSAPLNIDYPMVFICEPNAVLNWKNSHLNTDATISTGRNGATLFNSGYGINIDYGNYGGHKGVYRFGVLQGDKSYFNSGASLPYGHYWTGVRIANSDIVDIKAIYISYWQVGILVTATNSWTDNNIIKWDVMDDCETGLKIETVNNYTIENTQIIFNTIGIATRGIDIQGNGTFSNSTIQGSQIFVEMPNGVCISSNASWVNNIQYVINNVQNYNTDIGKLKSGNSEVFNGTILDAPKGDNNSYTLGLINPLTSDMILVKGYGNKLVNSYKHCSYTGDSPLILNVDVNAADYANSNTFFAVAKNVTANKGEVYKIYGRCFSSTYDSSKMINAVLLSSAPCLLIPKLIGYGTNGGFEIGIYALDNIVSSDIKMTVTII